MLAAGTMRFTDAPDTRAGDFGGASFPKKSPRAPPGRDASRENVVAEDDAFRLGEVVRELTTPDAAPEPATHVGGELQRRNVETYRATRDARGVLYGQTVTTSSDAFEPFWTLSDAFGHVRMHTDAFRCVCPILENFENFRIFFPEIWMFLDVFGID